MGIRLQVAQQLPRTSLRTIRWSVLLPVGALGAAIVRSSTSEHGDPVAIGMPLATTLLGVWLCLLFEDPAHEVTGSLPTPVWVRRAVRGWIAIGATACIWFAIAWIEPLTGPTAPMATMAGAVVVVSMACAAMAGRLVTPGRSGVVAAVAMVWIVLVLPIALALTLDRPLSIDPSAPPLGSVATYWSSICGAAAVALVVAHRDPARPPLRALVRPSPARLADPAPSSSAR
jgi:hypothetical protein